MKLSNAQMETYLQGLDACHSASGFPGMLIGIAHRRIANELKEYLLEKQKIFEKYGEKTENGWSIPQFSEEEFMEKFQDKALTAQNYDTLYDIFVRKEGN